MTTSSPPTLAVCTGSLLKLETAKSRALMCSRTCVLTRSTCLRAYVLAWLRACVLDVLACLRAYVPACSACLRVCLLNMFARFISSRPHISYMVTVLKYITCYVLVCLVSSFILFTLQFQKFSCKRI